LLHLAQGICLPSKEQFFFFFLTLLSILCSFRELHGEQEEATAPCLDLMRGAEMAYLSPDFPSRQPVPKPDH
jgi:hypothetical protein